MKAFLGSWKLILQDFPFLSKTESNIHFPQPSELCNWCFTRQESWHLVPKQWVVAKQAKIKEGNKSVSRICISSEFFLGQLVFHSKEQLFKIQTFSNINMLGADLYPVILLISRTAPPTAKRRIHHLGTSASVQSA